MKPVNELGGEVFNWSFKNVADVQFILPISKLH